VKILAGHLMCGQTSFSSFLRQGEKGPRPRAAGSIRCTKYEKCMVYMGSVCRNPLGNLVARRHYMVSRNIIILSVGALPVCLSN